MIDLRNDYVYLLNWLTRDGQRVTSRGLATREVTGVTLRFAYGPSTMLPIGTNRGVNLRLAAVEALQLLSGLDKSNLIAKAAPGFVDVLVDPTNPAYGAYGPRLARQLPALVELLRADPTTRRAVLTIWETRDLTHTGDRPCTLTLQFLVRNSALELHVNMRSQDAWLGLTYDAFMFTQVQHTVAALLGVAAGQYVHHVGSLHVYESDLDAIANLVTTARPAPRLPRGVNGTDPFVTATRLLDHTLDVDDAEALNNPWYVEQIGRLYA